MPAKPDYLRIADEIMADIRAGKYAPGDKLPSIAEFCRIYTVSPSTMQLVHIRLEALEVIRRHQGKGIFVTDPATWMRKP
ncbi:winged helix-turn-helix domain-containing protein [Solwaraspora sp. WMMA2080]|uniref:winged helix-turn-helix domain-containing protein n=1 Tax=unclassified Solwaraspora TaxID=2627926 RepID=UPI00248BC0E2|nr:MULTISPECIES: winged helix-turn-helix domain-containing protein [unclassified Solwaraspora]WBB96503.1 winged helix-turn-helix domain-containing protein [Solwaraspora sp. WMMA2059]WBC19591.1 winged helix-turn-helix domain-containing protein [Solwaraspora sp. WMMA2080]